MEARGSRHPAATVPGVFALALWAVYLLVALKNLPDLPYRVMISGSFGLLACLTVLFHFRYWRGALVLASVVYLATYAILVGRMTTMATGGGASLLSALSFYYSNSWVVTLGTFHERGLVDGSAQVFLEYGMPVLSVLLIVLVLMSPRANRGSRRP